MRPISPTRLVAATLLLSPAHHLVAAKPVDTTLTAVAAVAEAEAARGQSENQHDERGFLDVLNSVGGGNLTKDINAVITDASMLLQSFMAIIRDFNDATNENDLVNLLGVNVKSAKADDQKVTGNTIGAVGENATCPGIAVLFARGTVEPGNVGLFTGPSFFTALRNYINGSTTLAIQGVPYPASIPGFLVGGSPFGSALMASLVNKTAAACPNTKIVLSGYSQGCQVVHNAMSLINAPAPAAATALPADAAPAAPAVTPSTTSTAANTIAARQDTTSSSTTTTSTSSTAAATIAAATPTPPAPAPAAAAPRFVSAAQINAQVMSVVLFGDPRNGTAVSGTDAARVLSLCNAEDDICARGGDAVTLAHLTYNRNAPQAAMFVMQRSGLGVASADAVQQGMSNVPSVPAQEGVSGSTQLGTGPGLPGMAAFVKAGFFGLG